MSGLDEAAKSAWCRANGVHLNDLVAWRQSATPALEVPEEAEASPSQTNQDAHGHFIAIARGTRKLSQSKLVSDGKHFGPTWQLRHHRGEKKKEV